MYARSTSLTANPSALETGIAYVRNEILPAVTTQGCVGLSMMVDRRSGRSVVTTAWTTREAMAASRDAVLGLRRRAVELMAAGAPQVEEWEIAVLHRDHVTHPGACIRTAWFEGTPARIDDLVTTFAQQALPMFDGLHGFCSASMLVDRAGGRAVGSTCFENLQALQAARETQDRSRGDAAAQLGIDVVDVAEFDLALAHLRVPETV